MALYSWCRREVCVTRPDAPLADAVQKMHRHHVGAVVVVRDHGTRSFPIGIVTDRDVLRAQVIHKKDLFAMTAEEAMTRDPVTLSSYCDLTAAIGKMRATGVRRAPVIDDTGQLVGIVSVDDLVAVVAQKLGLLAKLLARQPSSEAEPSVRS